MKNFFFFLSMLLTLSVSAQVTISSSTSSGSICDGYFAFLYVDVAGYDNDALNYEWSRNGIYIPGANLDTIIQSPGIGWWHYQVTVSTLSNVYVGTAFYTLVVHGNPTISFSSNNVSCFGGSDGNITANMTGTGPFSYSWNTGNSGPSISGLPAGSYTLTVTDIHGCVASATHTIAQPALPVMITGMSTTNVSCYGGSNGSIGVSGSGGVGPYTYIWTGAGTGGNPRTNLSAGLYTVTIFDAHGCSATASTVVHQPNQLTFSAAITTVSCNGGSNGSIDLSVSGGTAPYSYAWSHGFSGQDPTGLAAGNYSVTITDAYGCTSIGPNWLVSQPVTPVYVTVSTLNPITCHGDNDASLQANVSGGTGPYTWEWSTGATSQIISNLGSGSYFVIVTDIHGCSNTASTVLTNPSVLSVDVQDNWSFCANSGEYFEATATGGNPYAGGGYIWEWSDGINTPFHLASPWAGSYNYSVTVTDANGCQATDNTFVYISADESPFAGINLSQTGPATWSFSAASIESGWLYLWDFGDGYQSTLSAVSHTYTNPGVYLVSLTVTNSCGSNTADWTIYVTTTTGVDELKDSAIRVYPNPVEQGQSILIDKLAQESVDVMVFDIVGNVVYSTNHNGRNGICIPTTWSAGVYYLRLQQGDQSLTRKLVVQ